MKHFVLPSLRKRGKMPPTRGHDLKQASGPALIQSIKDAPHTGARLETPAVCQVDAPLIRMPPTRGHDLKRGGDAGAGD